MIKIIFIVLITLFFSCNTVKIAELEEDNNRLSLEIEHLKITKQNLHDSLIHCQKNAVKLEARLDTVDVRRIATFFYDRFASIGSGPSLVLNTDDIFELNLADYENTLSISRIFSEKFIHEQIETVRPCSDALKTQQIKGSMDLGVEPDECFFRNANYWFKTQEPVDNYTIDNLRLEQNNASCLLRPYDLYEEQVHEWSQGLKLDFVKVERKWLIDAFYFSD